MKGKEYSWFWGFLIFGGLIAGGIMFLFAFPLVVIAIALLLIALR